MAQAPAPGLGFAYTDSDMAGPRRVSEVLWARAELSHMLLGF